MFWDVAFFQWNPINCGGNSVTPIGNKTVNDKQKFPSSNLNCCMMFIKLDMVGLQPEKHFSAVALNYYGAKHLGT